MEGEETVKVPLGIVSGSMPDIKKQSSQNLCLGVRLDNCLSALNDRCEIPIQKLSEVKYQANDVSIFSDMSRVN